MHDVPARQDSTSVGIGNGLRKCFNLREGVDKEMERLVAKIDEKRRG